MIIDTKQPIIERFQQSAPVDITAMAQALGLNVWEDDALPEGVSGKLFQDPFHGGPEKYSIVVRASDPYTRKRFTVAHEIAHFVLHRDRIGSSVTDDSLYRSNLTTREEVEANRFAADLLMPKALIKYYVDSYGTVNPRVLASIFKVSEPAMRIRLGM